METQVQKVYVAVGNDIRDGYKTLAWTLRKWSPQPFSIVLLHVTCNISNDFVYTPFGKLPASAVSEEKLQILSKYEQEKTYKLLSKYKAFCGKVKAEILKVEKHDEPIHQLIVDLMSRLKIGRLVMGMTFMKSSSWRSKSAISGAFYVHQNKPVFCELYIICGEKLVVLGEGHMEIEKLTDQPSIRNLLGRYFSQSSPLRRQKCSSPPSANQGSAENPRGNNVQELENYFQHLLSLNLNEEPDTPGSTNSNTNDEEEMEAVHCKIDEAHETIHLKRKEATVDAERRAKAEWAVTLCNTRAEELETLIKEETAPRLEMNNLLDTEKQKLHQVITDVEESKSRLNLLKELQAELSSKLQVSNKAKANAEAQLLKAEVTTTKMVREIEELRQQRDGFQRRIEFCRKEDALGTAARSSEPRCSYRDYTAEDVRSATHNFWEFLRLKSCGNWLNVYRGQIDHSTVVIKMLGSDNGMSPEKFQAVGEAS